jgi:hypothetical protein
MMFVLFYTLICFGLFLYQFVTVFSFAVQDPIKFAVAALAVALSKER